jgi:hypothetical protein
MVGNVEDLPWTAQQERLDDLAGRLVEIVDASEEPMYTRRVVEQASRDLSIAQSQAKYGLTYAKSSGRILMDPTTSVLTTPSRTSLSTH